MTWPEYDSMARGYFRRIERQQLNPARNIMALIANVNRGKGKPAIRAERMWPLSIDERPDAAPAKKMSAEDIQAMLARRGYNKKPDGKWQQLLKSA